MNIVEYTRKFQEMEIKEGLFNLKTSDGIYYWDIIRYDVFYFIFGEYFNNNTEQVNKIKKYNIPKVVNKFKGFWRDYRYFNKNKKQKYVFFTCSRNLINGDYKDIISDDYLSEIGGDSFIIETTNDSDIGKSYMNYLLAYKHKMNTFLTKILNKKTETYSIDEIFKRVLGISIQLDNFINHRVERYRVEKKHYYKLLSVLKPQIVFFVQNGIQKGLMSSCKELKIPIVELQHGIVNYCHATYSYPKEIGMDKQMEIIVPNFLFSFSDYWIKKVNYPVKQAIAMGNTHYSIPISSNDHLMNEITFISADIFQEKIESYLNYLLKNEHNTKVNLKLHPNQNNERDKIISKYGEYKNLNIYFNEVTLHELFKRSREVVVVTSTAVYEAIQFGCKVKIIKDSLSYDIEDVFNHPSVMVIDKPLDLTLNNENEPVKTQFFSSFSQEQFWDFMKSIEKDK